MINETNEQIETRVFLEELGFLIEELEMDLFLLERSRIRRWAEIHESNQVKKTKYPLDKSLHLL